MRTFPPGLMAGLIITLLATGCGGGGGGGGGNTNQEPDPPSPPEVPTFSLSGTITASDSQAVDSDTNDSTRVAISNDTAETAQPISNPVTLGGYVNIAGTGVSGRSQTQGDTEDYFRVDLLAGQTITLLVADFDQADADLYLRDTDDNILAFSIATGNVETLVIEKDGTYFVHVSAWIGATNYTLAIGAPNIAGASNAGQHPIMPWQAVVKYKDEEGPSPDNAAVEEDISHQWGMDRRAGGRGRGRLMALRRAQLTAQQTALRLGTARHNLPEFSDPALRARWETLMTIKSLRKDPRVRYAKPNYKIKTLAAPNDEAYSRQWHYPLIGLPDAWETTTGDPQVVVAVIDTGILANHPDLAGQLVGGYDFVRDQDNARDGDGIDPDPEDPGAPLASAASSFHGTHVSGTVAARGNNQIGVAGTAYTSRVMPLRALGGDGGGTTYDVEQAVLFAAGLPNDSGTLPQKRADIINLSLGGGPFDQDSQDLFDQVRAAGVMVVAAAGNEASSAPVYPASYAGVISVSAVDAQRRLARYSNTGAGIDVAAPGGDSNVDLNGDGYPDGILSTGGTFNGGSVNFSYTFLNGTSMAAPHVAGILALMKSVNPELTPQDIDAMLANGELSNDLGPSGRDDQFGHGIIDAQRSVFAALAATGNAPADNPRLISSASSLNFGSSSTSLELAIRNSGKGDLELLNLSVSEPWATITALTVDGSGLGTYQVDVNRTDLSAGIYSAEINAQSSVNNLAVRLLMSVGADGAATDVGVIYILLFDPPQEMPVAQFRSEGNGATYPFNFSGIPAGEYEIVAGSDADNDGLICDAGEACGAWLTTDQPIRFQLESNTAGFDFPVDFLVSLPSAANDKQPANLSPQATGYSRAVAE